MRLSLAAPIACVLTLWLVPADAAAQIVVHESGVKAGLAFTTLTYDRADPDTPEANRRRGFTGGLFAVRYLRPRLSVQAEGLLSIKGAQFEDQSLRLTYLEFPGLFRYELPLDGLSRNPIHVLAGPALAIKIDASVSGASRSEDVDGDFAAIDLGWVLGAGLEHDGILADVRYTWGLLNVPNRESESAPRVRNGTFTLMIGLRIPR